jgi:hypothetical protein
MSTRRYFVPGTLLAFLFAGAALAGQYQRTKDGRTLVWNEDHKPGDLVSWSGKRDADGYASGYGTLTWYAPEDTLETGSTVPRKQYRVSNRVSGTMVQGKFAEASAQDATRAQAVEPAKPKKRGWLSSIFRPRSKPTPVPIEPTPKPRRKSPSTHTEEAPEEPSPASTNAAANPTPASTASPSAANDSLDSLMHAPSSLKLNSPSPSPSPVNPSPAATPEVSLQLTQPASASPSPQ